MSAGNRDDDGDDDPTYPTRDTLLEKKDTSEGQLAVNVQRKEPQPPRWRLKLVALLASFVALGFTLCMNGPTLVDMGQLLDTDTKGMSISLSLHGAGYLIGAILCGLTFDRFHMELQLSLIVSLMGAFSMVAPWTGHLAGYSLLVCLRSACAGFLDSSGQAYALHVMRGHRLQDPALQSIHALFSVGATIGPLIIQPFLSPKLHDAQTFLNVSSESFIPVNKTYHGNGSDASMVVMNNTLVVPPTRVQFSFLILGSACIALSFLFWFIFLTGPKWCHRSKKKVERADWITERSEPRAFRLQLLALLFCWFFSYVWVEWIPGDFVATWVIRSQRWPKYTGPLLTSVFWATHGTGRLLAVPVSAALSPRQMMFISSTVTLLSFVILLVFHHRHQAVVWVTVGTAGLGMACSSGTMVLWASRHIRMDGAASSVCFIGNSCAKVIAPLITGYLFQEHSSMWFLYIITAAAFSDCVFFVSLEIFVRCYNRHKSHNVSNEMLDVSGSKSNKNEPVLELEQLKTQ